MHQSTMLGKKGSQPIDEESLCHKAHSRAFQARSPHSEAAQLRQYTHNVDGFRHWQLVFRGDFCTAHGPSTLADIWRACISARHHQKGMIGHIPCNSVERVQTCGTSIRAPAEPYSAPPYSALLAVTVQSVRLMMLLPSFASSPANQMAPPDGAAHIKAQSPIRVRELNEWSACGLPAPGGAASTMSQICVLLYNVTARMELRISSVALNSEAAGWNGAADCPAKSSYRAHSQEYHWHEGWLHWCRLSAEKTFESIVVEASGA